MDSADSDATIDEDARRRFEAAWRAGQPGSIEDYLPPAADSRRRATLEELVFIELECAWKRRHTEGEDAPPPNPVEGYLNRFPELADPPALRRLVREEWLVRHRFGQSPGRDEYRSRFPTLFPTETDLATFLPPYQPQKPLPDDTNPESAADPAAPVHFPAIPGHDLLRLLGRGGMGTVYLARQRRLGRLVAVKVIRGGGTGPEELVRFRAEAEAVARLQHPNVVQVFETGEWEADPGAPGLPYFTMEYVPGGSLADEMGGRPWPAADAARLTETLAQAIHAAHVEGIIHRDLKPGNILLGNAELGTRNAERKTNADGPLFRIPTSALRVPKITDFGLAKRLEQESGQTRTGDIVGTPSYMAPEQAAGKTKGIGPGSDVWALGAILYEMLTGRVPFRGETGWDTLQQVLNADPVPPRRLVPRLPRDLETITLRCLEKESVRRYTSATDLADDLHRFLAGEPIRARPVGMTGRTWKWAKRRPTAAGLVVLSSLVPVGLVAAGVWYTNQQTQRANESERERAATARQRDQSNANLAMAFDAIDRMVRHARDSRLTGIPEGEQTVRRLLEDAVDFCQKLLHQKSDDPKIIQFTALAYRLVGDAQTHLGAFDEATKSYRGALDLHERLIADGPGEPQYSLDLSGTLVNRAQMWDEAGRPADAAADLRRAVAVRRQLADVYPDRPAYRRELAAALSNLGAHYSDNGHYPEAVPEFAAARDLLDPLRTEMADDPLVKEAYAVCNTGLGLAHYHQQQWGPAEQHLREGARLHRELAARSAEPHHRVHLGNSLNNLGVVLRDSGRSADAERVFGEAVGIQQRLANEHPAVPSYRGDLGGTMTNLAVRVFSRHDPNSVHGLLGLVLRVMAYREAVEARDLLELARENLMFALKVKTIHPIYQSFLAINCATLADVALELGDHVLAAKAAAGLAANGLATQDAIDAAGQVVRCIPLVEKDKSLDPDQVRRLAAKYAEQTVMHLRLAIERGFRNVEDVKMKPEFAPIRDRPDFRKLLADVAAKK